MTDFFKKNYFWFMPVTVSVLMLVLKMVQFTEVDDLHMQEMALSFKTNLHSEQLMFISVIFGYILKTLYSVIPALNWFGIMYLSIITLDFVLFLKVISKFRDNAIIVCAVLIAFVYELRNLTFSGLAIITCGAAFLWLFVHVENLNKESIKHIVFAAILFITGYCMRGGMVLYCVVGIFLPLLVFSLINKKKSVAAVALMLVICVAANYSVIAVNRSYNASIPEETFFTEFNRYRSAASDAGTFNYDEKKEFFEEHNLSKNDVSLYSAFIFADKQVFNGDSVGAIAKSRGNNEKYELNPLNIVKELLSVKTAILNIFMYLFAVLALLFFILYKRKRLEIFFFSGFVIAEEVFLFFRRRGVPRITNPLAILGIVILIVLVAGEPNPLREFKKFDKKRFERILRAATALTVAGSVALCGVYSLYTYKKEREKTVSSVIEYVNDNSENVYVTIPINYVSMSDSHLHLLSGKVEYPNVCSIIGDWWVYSYYWYDMLNRYGLSDCADNAVNALLKDGVYFVTRQDFVLPYLTEFYREHYNLETKNEIVKEFDDGFKIVKYEIEKQG